MTEHGERVIEVRLDLGERPHRPRDYAAVLVLGGTAHPYEDELHAWLGPEIAFLEGVIAAGVPALGICLGAELLARAAGGDVRLADRLEIGWFPVELTDAAADDPLFTALPHRFPSFQWHEYVAGVPPGAVELARGDGGPQAYRLGETVWGVQFHPEVRFQQLASWIWSHGEAPPVPRERFLADATRHIPAWNEIGRALCTGFLDAAGRATSRGGRAKR
jgi:GMP synthase (glutamine-hydrolysing)